MVVSSIRGGKCCKSHNVARAIWCNARKTWYRLDLIRTLVLHLIFYLNWFSSLCRMNLIPLRLSIFLHKEHVNVRCAKSTSLAINTWNDVIHIKGPLSLLPFLQCIFRKWIELVFNSFFSADYLAIISTAKLPQLLRVRDFGMKYGQILTLPCSRAPYLNLVLAKHLFLWLPTQTNRGGANITPTFNWIIWFWGKVLRLFETSF